MMNLNFLPYLPPVNHTREITWIICDQICENVHSSHIQFFNFKGFIKYPLGMADSFETCRDYRAIIPIAIFLELCDISSRFYESLNKKNQMCELCTFSQIRSHTYMIMHAGFKQEVTLFTTILYHHLYHPPHIPYMILL